MRTKIQEWFSRIKTGGWSILWVGLAYAVDLMLQSMGMLNFPTFSFVLDFGNLTQGVVTGVVPVTINTSILVGIILNQASKYFHNKKAGKMI